MGLTRRSLLRTTLGTGVLFTASRRGKSDESSREVYQRLDEIASAPVLRVDAIEKPVKIASMELLRNRAELPRPGAIDRRCTRGLRVPNAMHMVHLYPIFLNRVAPFFVGKDARQLEALLWELYRHDDNYKYQGLALWVCVAAAEFAILDLLGKLDGQIDRRHAGRGQADARSRSTGPAAFGATRPRRKSHTSSRSSPRAGPRRSSFALGGRMSKNADSLPGRTERLIPLVRETFGPAMTLYADSNSSYDVPEAIRIGRLMEKYDYGFFEEPCRFDHLEDTKAVADALRIPIAGGEQEFSDYGFRWMIANRGVDIVQPDLHYYGGFIRSMRVARMAHAAGMLCTPHMSGSGLGYLDAVHFVSCIPNPVPFTEFKGDADIPVSSHTSTLKLRKRHGPRSLRPRFRNHHRSGVYPPVGQSYGLMNERQNTLNHGGPSPSASVPGKHRRVAAHGRRIQMRGCGKSNASN